MTPDIRTFFENYLDAFNSLDGEAVANFYAIPSGIASDKGYEHWVSRESIRDNMIALCKLYKDNGYVEARYKPTQFIKQGEQYCVVDILWHIERTDSATPWEFSATYNLILTTEGWRVLLCTAYSEKVPADLCE